MHTRARFILGFALALGAQIAAIPSAQACSGSNCKPEFFLPFEGTLPANAVGISWDAGHDDLGETQLADLSLSCAASDQVTHPVQLEAMDIGPFGQQLLVPTTALVEGEACELIGPRTDCGYEGADKQGRASFTVGASVPLPGTLGALSTSEASIQSVEASTIVGSCSVVHEACAIDLTIELSDEAKPWRDALVFTTYVDGQPWAHQRSLLVGNVTGGSAVGRGIDHVFAWSEAITAGDEPGLTPGAHSVEMRATLPGTDVELSTEAMPVDLDCASASDPNGVLAAGPDGGVAADPDGGVAADPGTPPPSDPQQDAGDDDHPYGNDHLIAQDDGGCSASGRTSDTTFGWLALALSALVARRRRRE